MLEPCRGADRCATFIDYSIHDPFCVFDPTCVSPFYNPTWSGGMAPHWDGLRWLNDPLLIWGNPLTMLAPPNYMAFMAVASLAIAAAVRWAKAGYQRGLLLTTVFTWCTFEIIGWFLTAAALVPGHNAAWVFGALMLLVPSMAL